MAKKKTKIKKVRLLKVIPVDETEHIVALEVTVADPPEIPVEPIPSEPLELGGDNGKSGWVRYIWNLLK